MINGDILLGQVYEAIRGNPSLWQNTLLIITYDEAGGFPDSVVCTERVPSVTGPLADKEPQRDFKFEFLGPRVPTLLISGYLQAGKLDSRTYEHASIPRSVKDVFSLDGGPKGGTRDDGFLTARDAAANSILDNGFFDFTRLRDDAPITVLPNSSNSKCAAGICGA